MEWVFEEHGSLRLVPRVRRWVRGVLAYQPVDLVDRVELIASEYVTSCLVVRRPGADQAIRVRLRTVGEHVRIEVSELTSGDDLAADWLPEEVDTYRCGLLLVTEFADQMGNEVGFGVRLAWAELSPCEASRCNCHA